MFRKAGLRRAHGGQRVPYQDRPPKRDVANRFLPTSKSLVGNALTCTMFNTLRLRYLSTMLDHLSRYIIAWNLCSTMRAQDVSDTLDMALQASGCDSAQIIRKPRLLSDNGPN